LKGYATTPFELQIFNFKPIYTEGSLFFDKNKNAAFSWKQEKSGIFMKYTEGSFGFAIFAKIVKNLKRERC
jgi:hypothetical protein